MKRENYKRHVLLARADKVREQPIWRARVAIDRFIDGNWQEVRIRSQLDGMEFTNEEDALTAATRMNELSAWLPDQWKQLQAARMANLQSAAPPAA